jgi:hypothetical protein
MSLEQVSLERQIEDAMVREAGTIGAANLTADAILHKGRSAQRRQRVRRTLAGVAAVALVVVAALTVTSLPGRDGKVPPGTQTWPFPTSPAQDGPSPASLRISYANGPVIVPWNAPRFTMAVPPQTYIIKGSRVAGGWVVTTVTGYHPAVAWFQPDGGGAPTQLVSTVWAVSDDGHTLVVAGPTEPTITAYRMPSMSTLGETRIPGQGHIIIGGLSVIGDGLLIYHDVNGVMPLQTSMWYPAWVSPIDLMANVVSAGTANGSVLRLYFSGAASCVDFLPISEVSRVDSSGTCTNNMDEITWAALSPDGRQAAIGRGIQPDVLGSTADLHAGLWRPTPITGATHFYRWDSATTFLATDDGALPTVLRCAGPAACANIGLPAGNPRITFLTDPS